MGYITLVTQQQMSCRKNPYFDIVKTGPSESKRIQIMINAQTKADELFECV